VDSKKRKQLPHLVNLSRFTLHDPRFTVHFSPFTIHNSRFTAFPDTPIHRHSDTYASPLLYRRWSPQAVLLYQVAGGELQLRFIQELLGFNDSVLVAKDIHHEDGCFLEYRRWRLA
jgi:hypothetical protein